MIYSAYNELKNKCTIRKIVNNEGQVLTLPLCPCCGVYVCPWDFFIISIRSSEVSLLEILTQPV